ncbi:hypothetical protein GWK47_010442 [Chionoecetes opilio]|uniref:IGFBP N-terminal domain-containing protein n=1 Tax=Chionoecetes opilio TaxID=41210 RepID=A0A8J4Y3H7_CHIOP|nr:hypothetical protein GWK47_010442 [Chionoecetes opilio]
MRCCPALLTATLLVVVTLQGCEAYRPYPYPHYPTSQPCGPCESLVRGSCRRIPHCPQKVQCGDCERRVGSACVRKHPCSASRPVPGLIGMGSSGFQESYEELQGSGRQHKVRSCNTWSLHSRYLPPAPSRTHDVPMRFASVAVADDEGEVAGQRKPQQRRRQESEE